MPAAQRVDGQHDRAGRGGRPRAFGDGRPDDGGDEGGVVELAPRGLGHLPAVAQDQDAVGEGAHLVEPVGDEDDASAFGGDATHRVE